MCRSYPPIHRVAPEIFTPRQPLSAAAGGVATIVIQPDTDPAIDEPAMVDFIRRRGAALDLVHVHVAGAATRGCDGKRMAEIVADLREAGFRFLQLLGRKRVRRRVYGGGHGGGSTLIPTGARARPRPGGRALAA